MAENPKRPKRGLGSIFAASRDIAFVVGIYAFFAGFIYRYFYLREFGITAQLDEKTIYSVLVYAYSVFQYVADTFVAPHLRNWIIFGVVVISLIAANGSLHSKYRRYRRVELRVLSELNRLSPVIVAVVAVVSFPLVATAARDAGIATARGYRTAINGTDFNVAVRLKKVQKLNTADSVFDFRETGRSLRVVTETGDRLFLIDQPYTAPGTRPVRGTVYSLPKDNLEQLLVVLPGREPGT